MEKLDWIGKLVKFGLTVKKITGYQYRVSCKPASMCIDIYPINKKFHDIETGARGVYEDEYLFCYKSFYRKAENNPVHKKINGNENIETKDVPSVSGGGGVPVQIDFSALNKLKELENGDGDMMTLKRNDGEKKSTALERLSLNTLRKTHFLQIDEKWLERILKGKKNCEVRLNDRDFQVGDRIQYVEMMVNTDEIVPITHSVIEITHVLHASQFPDGLKDGYCVLSLKVW